MTLVYAVAVWLVLLVLAILNGILREKVYQPRVREHTGHVISTAVFMVLVWSLAMLFLTLLPRKPGPAQLWAVGAGWAIATIVFEFLFGHYVARHSWERLLHDYNILEGRFWMLVLFSLLLAPPVLGTLIFK